MELEKTIDTEYIDSLLLTKNDMEMYNISATYDNVVKTIKDFKIARNKFITGCHVRLTPSYKPRLESFTKKKFDPIGDAVIDYFDSEEHYNQFNYRLKDLYLVMSEEEIMYLNDCLICGKSETEIKDKLNATRASLSLIKNSVIVRFALVFDLIVYK